MTSNQLPQQPHTPQWGPAAKPQSPQPGWARKRIVVPAAVVLFFTGVGIGASGSDGTQTTGDAKAAPTVTTTVTAKAAVPQTAEKAEPGPTVTKTVRAKPTAETADDSDGAAVPDFIGMGLQAAQDTAQAKGFYFLESHDSTGADRLQVLDRNWKVCTQNYKAGTVIPVGTEIDFGTVKLEENCP